MESAPYNLSFMSEARVHRKGDGVVILCNNSVQCEQMSYEKFALFKYFTLHLTSSSQTAFFIYRQLMMKTGFAFNLSLLNWF